jgi:putative pyruvate formate lyase activating enzyme
MKGMATREPGYVALSRSGLLAKRAATARERLSECRLCPYRCGIDRLTHPERGHCRTGPLPVVHSAGAHHGEEAPLRGTRGSGTLFFGRCNLNCIYCQNWDISQRGGGRPLTPAELAEVMLALEKQGCHNINLVSPTHVVAPILEAVDLAARRGLRLPLVYNSGGYDAVDTLELLDGVIDVYMPDAKYGVAGLGERLSDAPDYERVNKAAIGAMHAQVGDLVLDERGIAVRGLLVRHLVLPELPENTEGVLRFLANEISPDTFVNVMAQYRPCYRADEHPGLDRPLRPGEHTSALDVARRLGLRRVYGN